MNIISLLGIYKILPSFYIGLTWQSIQGSTSINDTLNSSKRRCGIIRPKNLFESFSTIGSADHPTTSTFTSHGKEGCLYESNIDEDSEFSNPFEGISAASVIYIEVRLYS